VCVCVRVCMCVCVFISNWCAHNRYMYVTAYVLITREGGGGKCVTVRCGGRVGDSKVAGVDCLLRISFSVNARCLSLARSALRNSIAPTEIQRWFGVQEPKESPVQEPKESPSNNQLLSQLPSPERQKKRRIQRKRTSNT
jgi:hypothetical protein